MNLASLIRAGRKFGASDIHVVANLSPVFRIDGEIVTSKAETITPELARALAYECLNEEQKRRFEAEWKLCFSTQIDDAGRARVTLYFRNGIPELSIRLSEPAIRTRAELGLPPVIDELARKPSGLVIITGPTGVGKTTTFHYMIDLINAESRYKIVTIEDPIEYVHPFKRSIVIQQELLSDVHSFGDALVHVLRQDPDVIGIGELRDRDTIHTALMAAETGHLVIATLHTPSTVELLQRMVSTFPEGQQGEIRYMLSNTLQGVVAQHLLPKASGKGRVLCYEVLVSTAGVRTHIRENSTHKIYSELQGGQKYQMSTMDHCLLDLYQAGEITYDTAVSMARYPDTIRERSA
ncbi:MAG: PilT/PilU family type 4a pilus ATPase [Phycisphaerae bacterium]